MNRWNIPEWLEQEVRARDRNCVYCGITFSVGSSPRSTRASWEHIVNDARITTRENIALCCVACNASKGAKHLAIWLDCTYCMSRGITKESISSVARAMLDGSKTLAT